MHKYNSYFPDDATAESLEADRQEMLQQMLGKVGNAPSIEPPLNIDYGCNITIGDSFYSNFKYVCQACCRPARPPPRHVQRKPQTHR